MCPHGSTFSLDITVLAGCFLFFWAFKPPRWIFVIKGSRDVGCQKAAANCEIIWKTIALLLGNNKIGLRQAPQKFEQKQMTN